MAVNVRDDIDPLEEFVPREFHPQPFRPEDIDPAKVVVSYDRPSDTLLIHLFGRGLATVSVPVGRYLYLMVTPDTETIVGFHIEGFLGQAVKDNPAAIDLLEYAELRGITPAEVRKLRWETPRNGRRADSALRKSPATSVQEERIQAVSTFIEAERSRWDLSVVPAIA